MNADRWPVAVLLGPVLVCASLALAHPPEPDAPPALLERPLPLDTSARASMRSQSQSAPAAGTAAASTAVPPAASAPWQVAPFVPFAPAVRTRTDSQWLYVESDGMPHAPLEFTMMVGIRAWQQQV
ncbi:MAG: hypothetical protein EXS04_01570, partial [Phycisphaerales bacterium]|nr:hypothetical protein [Phycisphaerales bacterium]